MLLSGKPWIKPRVTCIFFRVRLVLQVSGYAKEYHEKALRNYLKPESQKIHSPTRSMRYTMGWVSGITTNVQPISRILISWISYGKVTNLEKSEGGGEGKRKKQLMQGERTRKIMLRRRQRKVVHLQKQNPAQAMGKKVFMQSGNPLTPHFPLPPSQLLLMFCP